MGAWIGRRERPGPKGGVGPRQTIPAQRWWVCRLQSEFPCHIDHVPGREARVAWSVRVRPSFGIGRGGTCPPFSCGTCSARIGSQAGAAIPARTMVREFPDSPRGARLCVSSARGVDRGDTRRGGARLTTRVQNFHLCVVPVNVMCQHADRVVHSRACSAMHVLRSFGSALKALFGERMQPRSTRCRRRVASCRLARLMHAHPAAILVRHASASLRRASGERSTRVVHST